jgi:dTMP kinase
MHKKCTIIAIEGIDGSGKTMQSELLVTTLVENGIKAVLLKQPSGGAWGVKIRSMLRDPARVPDPVVEMVLFILDRMDQFITEIRPLGEDVVCILDRSHISSAVYQSGQKIKSDDIIRVNEIVVSRPDLVVLLDLSSWTAMDRIKTRGSAECFEKVELLSQFRHEYKKILKDNGINHVIIDAARDPGVIATDILKTVNLFLEKH